MEDSSTTTGTKHMTTATKETATQNKRNYAVYQNVILRDSDGEEWWSEIRASEYFETLEQAENYYSGVPDTFIKELN